MMIEISFYLFRTYLDGRIEKSIELIDWDSKINQTIGLQVGIGLYS